MYEISYVLFLLQTAREHTFHIRINKFSAWNDIPALCIRDNSNNIWEITPHYAPRPTHIQHGLNQQNSKATSINDPSKSHRRHKHI